VIHQASELGRQAVQPWHTSNQARRLAIRKQTDPKTSGRQTWCRACAVPTAAKMAANVLTLNSRVPTSCTAVACQSIWPGRSTKTLRRSAPGRRGAASTASRYCRKPAEVKNSEPMKNVSASGRAPTASTYAGTVPSANRIEPTAKSTPIHQSRSCGAHHVEPRRASGCRCLRWARDSQCAITPSGRFRTMKVANGPNPRSSIVSGCAGVKGGSASAWRLTATQDGPTAAGRHHPARMRSQRAKPMPARCGWTR